MINVPNLITLLRILITPLFVIFMLKGQYRLALLVFTLAGISDGLDGLFARWFNQKTVLGAHLDPIADKLLLISAFVVLAVQEIIPSPAGPGPFVLVDHRPEHGLRPPLCLCRNPHLEHPAGNRPQALITDIVGNPSISLDRTSPGC